MTVRERLDEMEKRASRQVMEFDWVEEIYDTGIGPGSQMVGYNGRLRMADDEKVRLCKSLRVAMEALDHGLLYICDPGIVQDMENATSTIEKIMNEKGGESE